MSKDRKPDRSRGELLDELSSIQTLLGDAAKDVAQDVLGEEEDGIPVLPPAEDLEGDAHTQIPLLGGGQPAADSAPLRQAASARDNPFLPKAAVAQARQNRHETSKAIEAMIEQRTTAPKPSAPQVRAPEAKTALSDAEVRALVDEVLAAWMPKLERELRERLTEQLRSKS